MMIRKCDANGCIAGFGLFRRLHCAYDRECFERRGWRDKSMADSKLDSLLDRFARRDRQALARLITHVENRSAEVSVVMERIYAHTGHAYIIGVTGAPGAGKSTLVNQLVAKYRAQNKLVAVLAIDPSSPFSGGAVLGDRLRMQSHAADTGVFIRSMATRGHLGGLARATADAALVLDASGKDIVIIETVGVGQAEVDIVRTADISIVMLVPGTGDDVQALKAGIMEIADVFVVNKADRDGADRLVSAIESNLSLQTFGPGDWRPPIVKTVATTGSGVPELLTAINAFRAHSTTKQAGRHRARSEARLREIVSERLMAKVDARALAAIVDRLSAREIDPYSAADAIVAAL